MSAGREFQFGMFDCFGDIRICIMAFLAPCYVLGKNSEDVGENCFLVGLLACVGIPLGPILRYRIRQRKGLKGSMATDALAYAVIPCCSMIQEAREIGWADANQGMVRY